MERKMILMGIIIGAHGIRGEVKVKSFAADPAAIAGYGPLRDAKDQRRFDLAVTSRRQAGAGQAGAAKRDGILVARIAGIADRNAAEALKGTELYVPREQLPSLTAKDEFYSADLVGLKVEDKDGKDLGRIASVDNFGASDVISVAEGPRGAFDLAFTRALVPVVDLDGKRVVVDLPEDFFDRPAERPGH
jgi:16S rRNA processing protein RimM